MGSSTVLAASVLTIAFSCDSPKLTAGCAEGATAAEAAGVTVCPMGALEKLDGEGWLKGLLPFGTVLPAPIDAPRPGTNVPPPCPPRAGL